jgi:hypothetical protein
MMTRLQKTGSRPVAALLLFGASLLPIAVLVVAGCDKKSPSITSQANDGGAPSNSTPIATTIQVDGTIDKWLKKTPAWDNGPAPADQSPGDIHVGKVFFDNDDHYLYVFLQCSPSIADRYKITQASGDIGGIFFDPDNNPDTGSPPESASSTNPNDRGYKSKLYLSIGVFTGASGGGTFVGYDQFRFTGQHLDDNNGFNAEIPNTYQDSMHPNQQIAAGKDGVELAIPLDLLNLKPGATARIMIEPSEPGSHNGFTKYLCH